MKRERNHLITALVFGVLFFALVATSSFSLEVDVSPSHLRPCSTATFTINVTNSGETPLDPVKVEDVLPSGMSYLSDDRGGSANDDSITWSNVGPLKVGESTPIHLTTLIGPCISGKLENTVEVTGIPPAGYNVTDNDTEELLVQSAPSRAGSKNQEEISIGDMTAAAFDFSGQKIGGAPSAENRLEIEMLEGQEICQIQIGDQSALAYSYGKSANKVRIITSQS